MNRSLPDIAAKPSDGADVKREFVNLGASVELPQLHRVLHIVHVAGNQLVPCHTCGPLQHVLPFLLSANCIMFNAHISVLNISIFTTCSPN